MQVVLLCTNVLRFTYSVAYSPLTGRSDAASFERSCGPSSACTAPETQMRSGEVRYGGGTGAIRAVRFVGAKRTAGRTC